MRRWHDYPGAWRVQFEPTPTPAWKPAWVALLLGGEATMPSEEETPPPHPRRQSATLASIDAALQWAHQQLLEAPQGSSVGFYHRGSRTVRYRARSGHDVRAIARERVGWDAAAPASTAPALAPTNIHRTAAQAAVVAHQGAPAVVVAVAGAGKTTTVVARIERLVRERVLAAETLLLLSFSRSAVAHLQAQLRQHAHLHSVQVRTFHSLAHAILRERAPTHPGHPGAAPPPEAMVARVVARATREAATRDPDLHSAWQTVDVHAFGAYRGRCLARLELPGQHDHLPVAARQRLRPPQQDPRAPHHRWLLEDFERVRAHCGWLDHDQRLVDAWLALVSDNALLARLKARYRATVVDEAQDMNPVQFELLDLIFGDCNDVMLVGDDDQSIYGFRGASGGLLQDFRERRNAVLLTLPDAFRSRAEPLAAATQLMRALHPQATLQPRAHRGSGGLLTLDRAADPDGEAELLVQRVLAQQHAGFPWQAQAVLLRRFLQAPAIEAALARASIPTRVEGAHPLHRHPSVVAAWAGVALALGDAGGHQANRERAWRRWLSGPGGLASPHAKALAGTLAPSDAPALEAWRRHAPRQAPAVLCDQLQRIAQALNVHAADALEAAGTSARDWPHPPPEALRRTIAQLRASGPSHGLDAWQAARARWRQAPTREAVLITSVHRAKGLEWPVVHVPGMNDGSFPLSDDPEERRLAYVAWTRAREALHLYLQTREPTSTFLTDSHWSALMALANDLRWLAQQPNQRTSLAGRWCLREARERFGDGAQGYDGVWMPAANGAAHIVPAAFAAGEQAPLPRG